MHGLFTAVLSAILLTSASVAPARAPSFLIHDVRVFDGVATHSREDVLVEGGRIAAVAPHLSPMAGISVIDGRGKTLLPGLIDSHVHIFPGARRDALRFGVTTELDMFDFGQDLAAWKRQRASLARTDQADAWAAGLGVTVKGGAPINHLPPDFKVPTLASADAAKAFVDQRVAEGSDYIKIFIEDLSEYGGAARLPTLTPEEVCAVVAAAHADGKLAIVHAQAEAAGREAIDCGADGLAHMIPDKRLGPAFLALAKRRRIFVLTTDSVWAAASGLELAETLAADPRVAPYLSEDQKSTMLVKDTRTVASFFPTALTNTAALHRAGVPVLAGTDSGNEGTAHGVTLHQELQALVEAGLTPEQALNAATALPSQIFKLGHRGRVLPGYRADLLLVDGDPTKDISATLSIDGIWMNGFPVDRTPNAREGR